MHFLYDPEIPLLRLLKKSENECAYKNLHVNYYRIYVIVKNGKQPNVPKLRNG